jgi:hypothetical protein
MMTSSTGMMYVRLNNHQNRPYGVYVYKFRADSHPHLRYVLWEIRAITFRQDLLLLAAKQSIRALGTRDRLRK